MQRGCCGTALLIALALCSTAALCPLRAEGRSDDAELLFDPSGSRSAQNPAFSPDGSTVLFTLFHAGYNDGPAGLYLLDLDGDGTPEPLFFEDDQDSVNLPGSSWNPILNRITFSSDREETDEVWTIDPDGTGLFRVTDHGDGRHFIEPSFSPAGDWIVFEAANDAPEDLRQGSIWKVRVDGSESVRLTDGTGNGRDDRQPNWSPTGERILFQGRLPGSDAWDILTMKPDGTDVRQITDDASSDTDASWSPDGRWIVYSSDYGGMPLPNIFMIPADGGTPVRISNSDTDEDGAPSWSANGHWIAFESHAGDNDLPAALWRVPVTMPSVGVHATGSDSPGTAVSGEEITLSVSVAAGDLQGHPADWWLVAVSPGGELKYFDLASLSFLAGLAPTYQGSLFDVPLAPVATATMTEPGAYQFYFGIDVSPDGAVNQPLYYGSAHVEVLAGPLPPNGEIWRPSPGTSWQWQLVDQIDTSFDVDMYDVDLFNTPASVVDRLHADGRVVICYFSAGSSEDWREDFARFPAAVLGKGLDGWPGERWLDVRRIETLGPIMADRLDLAVRKGCDGVEPDNVDAYLNDSGFPLTAGDQLAYNIWLAEEAHEHGLSVGLKNDLDQVESLVSYFDWALNEQCFQYDECASLLPFVEAGKAVFGVEYELDTSAFCPAANAMNFDWLRKNYDLDAWRVSCR